MVTRSRGTAQLAVISPALPAQRPRPGNRVLVPVIRGQSAAALLSIGDAIAADCPSRGIVLSLVEIPSRWSGMVTSAVVRSRELLRWIAASDYQADAPRSERLSIQSRFTTDPATSIRETSLETGCDTVLLEYPPVNGRRRHRLESIVRTLSDDRQFNLVVARPDPAANALGVRPRSVLVPLRGGPNAWLALSIGLALASWAEARLTLMHVYDPSHHHNLRRHEAEIFHELTLAARTANPDICELESDDPAASIFAVARGYDAVILGAHANLDRAGALVGDMFSSLMNRLSKTVILTRAAVDIGLVA